MKIEIHPLSATVGAIATVLLLFACSSSSGGSAGIPPLQPTPSVSTQVTFYADANTPNPASSWGPSTTVYSLGTTPAPTVITDISWAGTLWDARLMVNGVPAYAWGFGGTFLGGAGSFFAVPSRFSLAEGIRVPANAVLTVETAGGSGNPRAISLAGYTQ